MFKCTVPAVADTRDPAHKVDIKPCAQTPAPSITTANRFRPATVPVCLACRQIGRLVVSNRISSVRLAVSLALLAATAVSGCSWLHHGDQPAVSAMTPPPPPRDSEEALPPDELTATEAAVSSAGASANADSAAAPSDYSSMINPSAPKSYTVKRGDTLWAIAATFLRDPWLWPEVWYINPKVENPHLISPGDVLALAYGKDGKPMIRLEQGGAARLD